MTMDAARFTFDPPMARKFIMALTVDEPTQIEIRDNLLILAGACMWRAITRHAPEEFQTAIDTGDVEPLGKCSGLLLNVLMKNFGLCFPALGSDADDTPITFVLFNPESN
jgi:hypothetical protein